MESFGNEIRVQQGESFNLDMLISGGSRTYVPYLVSSERTNPYFIVTVASTKFEKNHRYVKSWWCSLDTMGIPTFYSTVPISWKTDIASTDELPTAPSTDETDATYGDSATNRNLYSYTIADDSTVYYFYFTYDSEGTATRVDGYECRLIFNFLSTDTAEWGSQNYLYQVTLVSGPTMAARLQEIKDKYSISDSQWPSDVVAQYKYVKAQYPNELQPDIDEDSPLGYIDVPEVILQPTSLQVYNNLRRLI